MNIRQWPQLRAHLYDHFGRSLAEHPDVTVLISGMIGSR